MIGSQEPLGERVVRSLAEAHAALGEAYRQAKDPVAARAEAERALALDPESADAKALLARLEGR